MWVVLCSVVGTKPNIYLYSEVLFLELQWLSSLIVLLIHILGIYVFGLPAILSHDPILVKCCEPSIIENYTSFRVVFVNLITCCLRSDGNLTRGIFLLLFKRFDM